MSDPNDFELETANGLEAVAMMDVEDTAAIAAAAPTTAANDDTFLLEEAIAEEWMKDDEQALLSSGRQVSRETETSNNDTGLSGRPPVSLYLSCNDDHISPYQVLVRKQIDLFEAQEEDVAVNAQGRNKPIVLGQVGIRCRQCSPGPLQSPRRPSVGQEAGRGTDGRRGAVYYPAKLQGLYQAAQNMSSVHLMGVCQHIPAEVRQQLTKLKSSSSSRPTGSGSSGHKSGMGKDYWAETAKAVGVYEDEQSECLRFVRGFKWDYVSTSV